MTYNLDSLTPKFKNLVDLLFFSNRVDLDLSNLEELTSDHIEYIWTRFKNGIEIFWEDDELLWNYRLTFLFSLNDKNLSKKMSDLIEHRMFALARTKYELSIKHDSAYSQFVQYCKVKHARGESLLSIKNYLTELPAHIKTYKIVEFINNFIPSIFNSFDEYAEFIAKKIVHSARNFTLLLELEKIGVTINRDPVVGLAVEILEEDLFDDKHQRAFLVVINDLLIRDKLKTKHSNLLKSKLLAFTKECDYSILEEKHLINISNLISLSPDSADELALTYCDKIYHRRTGHKRANIDRIIRLLKKHPEVSDRKVLAYFSNSSKLTDIKYLIAAFPDLKKLAPFV